MPLQIMQNVHPASWFLFDGAMLRQISVKHFFILYRLFCCFVAVAVIVFLFLVLWLFFFKLV